MTRTRVCIVGCGFGGIAAARRLARYRREVAVTVLDKGHTFSFLPVLPDCIGRGIGPGYASVRIEGLSKKFGFNFINEEVISLDLERREMRTAASTCAYDYAVIASGTETNFYGNTGLQDNALKIDGVDDIEVMLRELDAHGYAAYIIAGGGYTGVEIATNLRLYLSKRGKEAKVIIAEKAPSILGPLPDWMKAYVLRNLKALGVEVYTGTVIERVQGATLSLSDGREFSSARLIWVAGVKTPGFVQALNLKKNPQGRLEVDEYLRVRQECFAVGDSAYYIHNGMPLRMAVQFAMTQGEHAAVNIVRSIRGEGLLRYKPSDLGYIIPMANNNSCGRVFGVNVRGFLATCLHFSMCVYRSYGLRNKQGIVKGLLQGGGRKMNSIALLILRVGLGVMFTAHGLQMAFGMLGGPGVKGFSGALSSLGFSPAIFWAYVGAYTTLVGGICLILGLLTRVAAFFLLVFITVAALKVHLAKGFFIQGGGFEYTFIIACVCLALILLGPGTISINKDF